MPLTQSSPPAGRRTNPPLNDSPPSGRRRNRPRRTNPLSTRGGTIAVAGALALLAGLILLVFLHQYRAGLTGSDRVRVLVASTFIPQGTPGRIILDQKAYRVASVRKSDLQEGAIVDPNAIAQGMARSDMYSGHPLNAKDFQPTKGIPLAQLATYQRAITVPVDAAHGMVGDIRYGSRVDVLSAARGGGAHPSPAHVLARNVLVLGVNRGAQGGGVASGGSHQTVTLRVDDAATAQIAGAAETGKVWLVLRPPLGALSRQGSHNP
jgi:Flp pilus assembly protein CpaB